MALKATIFKAELEISDFDRHYYATHNLTIARHPSETDERMMVRVLAFVLNANESLMFGAGLSSSEEADVWLKDLTGAISLWIDVGLPDPKLLRRCAGRAAEVVLYAFGRDPDIWWAQNRHALERIDHLAVFKIASAGSQALAALATRNMRLRCSVQDGAATLSAGDAEVQIVPAELKPRRPSAPYRK
jgi:uncharacterized protein YaeQ